MSTSTSSSFVQGTLVGPNNLEALQKLGGINNNVAISDTSSSSSPPSVYLAEIFDTSLGRVLDKIATACLVAGGTPYTSSSSISNRPALSLSLAKRRMKQEQQSSSYTELYRRLQDLSTSSRFEFYGSVDNSNHNAGSGMGAVLGRVRKHMSSSTREATVKAWDALLQQKQQATVYSPSVASPPPPGAAPAAVDGSSDGSKPKRVLRLGASRLQKVNAIADTNNNQDGNKDDNDDEHHDADIVVKAEKEEEDDARVHNLQTPNSTTTPPTNHVEGQAEQQDTVVLMTDITAVKSEECKEDDEKEDLIKSVNDTALTPNDTPAAAATTTSLAAEEEGVVYGDTSGLNDDSKFTAAEQEGNEAVGEQDNDTKKKNMFDDESAAVVGARTGGTAKVVHSIITASIHMRSKTTAEDDDDDLLNELLMDDEPVIERKQQNTAECDGVEEDEVKALERPGKAEEGEVATTIPPPPPPQVDGDKKDTTDENQADLTNKAEIVVPVPTPAPRSLFSKRIPIAPPSSSATSTFPIMITSPSARTITNRSAPPPSIGCLQVLLQPLSFRWRLLLSHLQEAIFRKYSPDSTEYQLLWCLLPRLLETEIQSTMMSKGVIQGCLRSLGSGGIAATSSSSSSSSALLMSLLLRDIHTFSFTDIPSPTIFQSALDASSTEGLRLLLLLGGDSLDRSASSLLATTLTVQTTQLSPDEVRSVVLRKSLQRLCDSLCLSDLDHYHWFLNATLQENSSISGKGGGGGIGGRGAATSSSSSSSSSTAQIAADHLRGIFLFPVTDDIAPGYSTKNRAPISLLEVHERIRRSLSSTIPSPIIISTTSSLSPNSLAPPPPPPPPHPSDISTLDELLDDISRISTNADAYHGPGTVLSRKASVLVSSISKPSVRKRLTQYYLGDRWNRHLLEPLRKSLQSGWIANSETISLFNNSMLLAITEDYACGLQESALWTVMTNTFENNTNSNIGYGATTAAVGVLKSIGMPAGASIDTITAVPNPYVFVGGEPVHCGSAVSAIDQGGGVRDASLFPTFMKTSTSSEATSSSSMMILDQVDSILKRIDAISAISTLAPSPSCRLLAPIGHLFTKTVLSSLRGMSSADVVEWRGLSVVSSRVGLVSYPGRLRGAPIPILPSPTPPSGELHSDPNATSRGSVIAVGGVRAAQNSRANKEAAERFNKLAGSWDHRDVVRGDTTTSSVASSTPPGKSPVAKRMTRRSAGVVIDVDQPAEVVGGSRVDVKRAPLLTRRQMMVAAAEEEQRAVEAAAAGGRRGAAGKRGTVVTSEVIAETKKPEVPKTSTSSSKPLTKLMYWWAECSCGSWRLVSEEIKDAVGRGDLVDFTCKMVKKKCNTADDELPALGGGLTLLNVESKVVDDDQKSDSIPTPNAPPKRGRKKKDTTLDTTSSKEAKKASKAEEKEQKAAEKKMLKKAKKEEASLEKKKRGRKPSEKIEATAKKSGGGALTAEDLLKADKKEKADWKRNFKAAAALSKQQQQAHQSHQDDYTTTTARTKPHLYDDESEEDEDDQMLLNLAPAVVPSSGAPPSALIRHQQQDQHPSHTKKIVKSSRRAESSSSDSSSSSSASTSSSSSSSSNSSGSSSGGTSDDDNAPKRKKGAMEPPRMAKSSSNKNNKRSEMQSMMPPPPSFSSSSKKHDSSAGNKRVRGGGGASGGISPAVAGMLGGAGGLQHQVTGVNFQNAIKTVTDSRKVQLFEEMKKTLDELDQLTQQLSNLKQLPHALHHAIPQQLPPGKSVIEYLKTDVSGNHPAPPRPPSRSAPNVLAEYAAKLTWGSLQKEEARRVQVAQRTLIRKLQWCRTQLGLDKFDTQF